MRGVSRAARPRPMPPELADPVVWSDVECGSYAADLPLWERLAAECGDPILELGCGSGRVALHLGRLGHRVIGLDIEPALARSVSERAASEGLAVEGAVGDARALDLGRRFRLVLAPMQMAQLLAGTRELAAMLRGVAAHLIVGGTAAFALLDPGAAVPEEHEGQDANPLPDVRERNGWAFSSLPLPVRRRGGTTEVRRLRQAVSPAGELSEAMDVIRLSPLAPERLEAEARGAGLEPAGRCQIPPTEIHVGSVAVLLRAPVPPGTAEGSP